MKFNVTRKKALEVAAGQTVCSFIFKCHVGGRNVHVIHKISHCCGKRNISNSRDQIWIYVCLYCEINIERTRVHDTYGKKALRSLEQSASRIRDYQKISPNNEAHEETVHVEKSNNGVVIA